MGTPRRTTATSTRTALAAIDQPDNRALRAAFALQVPIIHFVSTRPGVTTSRSIRASWWRDDPGYPLACWCRPGRWSARSTSKSQLPSSTRSSASTSSARPGCASTRRGLPRTGRARVRRTMRDLSASRSRDSLTPRTSSATRRSTDCRRSVTGSASAQFTTAPSTTTSLGSRLITKCELARRLRDEEDDRCSSSSKGSMDNRSSRQSELRGAPIANDSPNGSSGSQPAPDLCAGRTRAPDLHRQRRGDNDRGGFTFSSMDRPTQSLPRSE